MNLLKNTEFYTLKRWMLWHVNYISVKTGRSRDWLCLKLKKNTPRKSIFESWKSVWSNTPACLLSCFIVQGRQGSFSHSTDFTLHLKVRRSRAVPSYNVLLRQIGSWQISNFFDSQILLHARAWGITTYWYSDISQKRLTNREVSDSKSNVN